MRDVEAGTVTECPEHGFRVPLIRVNGPHLEARCDLCHRYIKFVPKTKEWLALVR